MEPPFCVASPSPHSPQSNERHRIVGHAPGDLVFLILKPERRFRLQIPHDHLDQFRRVVTPMVPRDMLPHQPPDPFHRIGVRAVRRQHLQLDPIAVLPEVDPHFVAVMELGAVADHMDLPIAPQPMPQVLQMGQEELRIPLRPTGGEDHPGPPVDRAGDVPLLVGPRRGDGGLLAAPHPHPADLGVGVDVRLVLPDDRLIGRRPGQELAQSLQLGLPSLVLRPDGRPWSAIDDPAAVQPAADCLRADVEPVSAPQQQGQHPAGPAAAEEAEITRQLGGHPVDHDGEAFGVEAKGAAELAPGDALGALLVEPLDPAVDGAGAAEEHGGDLLPGEAIGQQQQDMGAESDLGAGILAISVEQRLVLPGVEVHAARHGCRYPVDGWN
jgi:hypothetical protein